MTTIRCVGLLCVAACLAAAAAAPLAAQAQPEIVACYDASTNSQGKPQGSGLVYRINVPGVVGQPGCVKPEHVQFSWTIQHGALTGLDADAHKQYLLADGDRSTTNGFAVTGTFGRGTIPASGPGARLMWYPGKAAFRVGVVTEESSVLWDDAQIGIGSVGMGMFALASGEHAIAIGGGTQATAHGTVAIGSGIASGQSSVALRGGIASGLFAVAIGGQASGSSAIAIGNSQAVGPQTTAIGQNATAVGINAVAIGQGTFASGQGSVALGTRANTNEQSGSFVYGDGSPFQVTATAPNQFVVRAAGGTIFYSNAGLTAGVSLAPGAGAWASVSDVNRKEHFRDVDGEAVLGKISRMLIQEWNYKSQRASVRHLGPTAQDFRAAFGLGESDTTITTTDIDGINLLAVQALERRTREQAKEIEALRTELAALRAEVARRKQ